jgi:hypothetical protein
VAIPGAPKFSVKYILAIVFGIFALLPFARAVSGLRYGVIELKLYLLAKRSERPALYWTFLCANLLASALLLLAGVFTLAR